MNSLQHQNTSGLTEREMFEASFQRPKNYFHLPEKEQWSIDASLGILDWSGDGLKESDIARYHAHYQGSLA